MEENYKMLDEIIEAQKEINKFENYTIQNDNGIINKYLKQLKKYLIFNYIINAEPLQLYYMYEKKLKNIAEMIYNPMFSKKQNILNVLEYIRIMTMYENVKQETDEDKEILKVNKHPIFLAFMGKGVCFAQAKFARDILLHLGIKAEDVRVSMYNSYLNKISEHQDVIAEIDNNEKAYIDPSSYNGTLDGIQFEIQKQNKKKIEKVGVQTEFFATQEEIKKSRDFIFPKLIKMIGIDKISKQLKLQYKSNLEKQCTIMAFVESRINLTYDLNTTIASANVNEYNIEVGKLMELFYYHNNIEYKLQCEGDKRNTIYETKIGNCETCFYPKLAYNSKEKAKILLNQTHYIRKGENNVTLLYSLNEDMNETYTHFINQGRLEVLYITINDICRANNLDINIFMKEPIENMKKYAANINVNPEIMKTITQYLEIKHKLIPNSKIEDQSLKGEDGNR